jgi:cell division protease FtsH
MVCEWGMSEKMGPITYGHKEEQVFLGRDFNAQKNFSDETAKLIDLEVKALVMGGYNRAKTLLEENRDILEKIALALLEHETLNAVEINEIIKGKPVSDVLGNVGVEPVKLKDKAKPEGAGGLIGGAGYPDPQPA